MKMKKSISAAKWQAPLLLSCVVLVPVVVCSLAVAADESATLVAPLQNQSAIRGCSWTASAPVLGEGFVFLAEYDDSEILMNIDGSDVALELIDETGSLKLGEVLHRNYRGPGIAVSASYTSTWNCSMVPESESCEVTKFSATFEVKKNERTQIVQATGEVGC